MKVPVSILVPIKNEAENLPRCLRSVAWADEIWVVDSQSTDGSPGIAEALGAKLVQFHLEGTWPKKRNWALDTLPFAHDWVFLIDADEELAPDAEEEVRRIVSDPGRSLAGYWINRRFMIFGQWLGHAYYPNWNLRLFRHRLGRFEKLTDEATASGDMEIHEHLVVRGEAGRLRTEMNHYAFPDVFTFVEKHNRYSNWEARVSLDDLAAKGGAHLQNADVRRRRWLRRMSLRLPCRPLLRFCYVYFWQRGFLDGRAGYYFARLHATYEFLCVAKAFELRRSRQAGGHSRRPD